MTDAEIGGRLRALWELQQKRRVPVTADWCRDGRCNACGRPLGQLHQGLWGDMCGAERCGNCGGQRISCGCESDEWNVMLRSIFAPHDEWDEDEEAQG